MHIMDFFENFSGTKVTGKVRGCLYEKEAQVGNWLYICTALNIKCTSEGLFQDSNREHSWIRYPHPFFRADHPRGRPLPAFLGRPWAGLIGWLTQFTESYLLNWRNNMLENKHEVNVCLNFLYFTSGRNEFHLSFHWFQLNFTTRRISIDFPFRFNWIEFVFSANGIWVINVRVLDLHCKFTELKVKY